MTLIVGAFFLCLILALFSAAGFGAALISYFVLNWGYGAFCEGLFNGQTVGKKWLRIRVLSEQGVPISGTKAILRNLVGTVDGLLPFGFLIGLRACSCRASFNEWATWRPARWS